MREIKFRAWSMHDEIMMDWNNLCSADLNGFFDEYNNKYRGDGIILMQYIGLKDKNGKEIYEGDIIKIENVLVGKFSDSEQKTFICYSVYASGAFYAVNTRGYCQLIGDKPSAYEIIGNMYENSELLEQL